MVDHSHRDTIFVEDAEIIAHDACDAHQYVLTLRAPNCAARARAGSFVHLQCDPLLPMRRPLSIMRADPQRGTIQMLYKSLGLGLEQLAKKKPGTSISVLGPIGQGFTPHADRPRTLLIGGGVGIPPMVFLAETLRSRTDAEWRPFVLMGSEIPFPFRTRPSTLMVPGIPAGAIATMPLLEEWGIPCRLASLKDFPGVFNGYITELADTWLATLDTDARRQVEVFACGPTPMLKAVAAVARKFDVACQVSLEEYMACAVGGCAGCTVKVMTPSGPAMKRVCVDGPVFDARLVYE